MKGRFSQDEEENALGIITFILFSQHGILFKSVFYLIGSVLYLIEQYACFQWQIDGLGLGCPRNYESSQTEKIWFAGCRIFRFFWKNMFFSFLPTSFHQW